jgi:peptide/nickel transport system permease protein
MTTDNAHGPVRLLESLVPGLGHLRRGYVGAGSRFLIFTLLWGLIVVFRGSSIAALFTPFRFGSAVALLLLLLLPAVLVRLADGSLRHLVEPPPREGLGTWALAWRQLRRNPRATWGLTLLALFYLAAGLAPVLTPFDPNVPGNGGVLVHKLRAPGTQVLLVGSPDLGETACDKLTVYGDVAVLDRREERAQEVALLEDLGVPPRGWSRRADTVREATVNDVTFPYRTETYLLGTDSQGRDLLSRLLFGSQISLFIGFVAMFVAVTLGIFFGSVAGYFGGWIDNLIMRLVDILLAFPRLLLLLLIVSVYPDAGIFVVIAILGATGWMGISRLVRAEFLRIKELDYAHAARSFGFSQGRIMFRHLLPNSVAPIIVNATLLIGNTILVEAALSFLGFGVQPPEASWGNIISDGQAHLRDAWWISTIPGLLIVFAVVCFNLVGDALRDALDPKQQA